MPWFVAGTIAIFALLVVLGAVRRTLRRNRSRMPQLPGAARPTGPFAAPASDFERLLGPPPRGRKAAPPPRAAVPGPCRWVRDAFRHDAGSHRWVCDICGAEDYTRQQVAPALCKRPEKRLAPD